MNMRVFHRSCAGNELLKSGCSDKEVRVGWTLPEGDASLDDFLNSLAFPIPISREASVGVW